MSPEEFVHIIQYPSAHEAEQFKTLIKAHPYCQSLRLAYLRKLDIENHKDFENELTVTATYAPNRAFLYNFLNQINTDDGHNSADLILPPLAPTVEATEKTETTTEVLDLAPIDDQELAAPTLIEAEKEPPKEENSEKEQVVQEQTFNDFSPPDEEPQDDMNDDLETDLLENALQAIEEEKEQHPLLEDTTTTSEIETPATSETEVVKTLPEKKKINSTFIVQEIIMENNRLAKGHHIEEDVDNFLLEEELEQIDAAIKPKELSSLYIFREEDNKDLKTASEKMKQKEPLHKVIYDKIKKEETPPDDIQNTTQENPLPHKEAGKTANQQKIKAFFQKISEPNTAHIENESVSPPPRKKKAKSEKKRAKTIEALQFLEDAVEITTYESPLNDHPKTVVKAIAYQTNTLIFNETKKKKRTAKPNKKKKMITKADRLRKKQQIKALLTKIVTQSLDKKNSFISETLAQLLEAQGKRKQALKMYHQLILKNPEKSTYFARKIKELLK